MIDVRLQLKRVGEFYQKGDFQAGLIQLQEIWNSIHEPKTDVPNSYLIIEYAVKLSMKAGDLDKAWDWASLASQFKLHRKDLGEVECLLGIVAFERGDLQKAKEQLSIAHEKSKGRIFQGEDPKYKNFLVSSS